MWGDRMSASDLTAPNAYQLIQPHSDMLLRAVRTKVLLFNGPAFSNLKLSLYSVYNSLPAALICNSSNSYAKADVSAHDNACREIFFEFNPPHGRELVASEIYALVLSASGYSGDETSNLGWKKAWPDPSYALNFTPTMEHINTAPYDLTLIGAQA